MIAAGRLRQRITIEQPVTYRDEYGSEVTTWGVLAEVWAGVMTSRGIERYVSDQRLAEVDVVFQCRYRPDIDVTMRIIYGGHVHEITSVIDVLDRHDELRIGAIREVPARGAID